MDLVQVHDRAFKPFISAQEIEEMVQKIANTINADFASEELTALVIMKGAMFFASDLLRKIHVPVKVETLRAHSYGDNMLSSGSVFIPESVADLSGQNVLIIEDIVDTGTTIAELIKHIAGQTPKSITVAALLSKPQMHSQVLSIDYVGAEIPPAFVVGYGMDYAGYGRGLDAIYVVVEPEPTT